MEHLNYEALARLVDEEPTATEREHLTHCVSCRASLADFRQQTEDLTSLPSLAPPRGDWTEIEARLTSEGLIRDRGVRDWLAWSLSAGWMKAAAVAAIFAAGAVTGSAAAERSALAELESIGALAATDDVRDLDSAERAVQLAEQRYAQSLLAYRRLLATDQPVPGDDPLRRAQALDLLIQAGQNAVRAAPDDPYINSFLVNVLTERQASSRTARSGDNWF